MDSDVPDLVTLQAICHRYGASLLVDVAHDLGCIGDQGGGYMELQNMTGKADIVIGSFSKSFASNGGFVASNHPALKLALRASCGPQTFSNSMSPVQASIVLACLKIIKSDEGRVRRHRLMSNIVSMRQKLEKVEFDVLGQPSPIIPIILGDSAVSRLATRFALEAGALINLVEYPAVSRNNSRWRCQMMADHRAEHIDRFVRIALASSQRAREPESQRAREPESQRAR
jgi:glycine C-acetyltransferase